MKLDNMINDYLESLDPWTTDETKTFLSEKIRDAYCDSEKPVSEDEASDCFKRTVEIAERMLHEQQRLYRVRWRQTLCEEFDVPAISGDDAIEKVANGSYGDIDAIESNDYEIVPTQELKISPTIYLPLLADETKEEAVSRLIEILYSAGLDVLNCSLDADKAEIQEK